MSICDLLVIALVSSVVGESTGWLAGIWRVRRERRKNGLLLISMAELAAKARIKEAMSSGIGRRG